MERQIDVLTRVPALTAAVLLSLIALLHAYWGLGGLWPGRDPESLARLVVGGPTGMRPPPAWACFTVTALLLLATWLVLAAVGLTGSGRLPQALVRLAALGVAAVLLLRGVVGFFPHRLRPAVIGSPFERLNLWVYSPLCLGLGSLVCAALLRSGGA